MEVGSHRVRCNSNECTTISGRTAMILCAYLLWVISLLCLGLIESWSKLMDWSFYYVILSKLLCPLQIRGLLTIYSSNLDVAWHISDGGTKNKLCERFFFDLVRFLLYKIINRLHCKLQYFIISFEKRMPMNGLTTIVPLTLRIIYFDEQEQRGGSCFSFFHFILLSIIQKD